MIELKKLLPTAAATLGVLMATSALSAPMADGSNTIEYILGSIQVTILNIFFNLFEFAVDLHLQHHSLLGITD